MLLEVEIIKKLKKGVATLTTPCVKTVYLKIQKWFRAAL
jgi:hypothetical protein